MQNKLFQLFKQFALSQWKWYLAGTVVLFVTSFISLKIPDLSKEIINSFASGTDITQHKDLALIIIALGCLLLVVRVSSRVLLFWPARVLESGVKDYYYEKFLKVQQRFLEKFGMGDLISRISNDVTHIRVFFGFGALQIFNFTFMVSLALMKMLAIDKLLTLYAILPILLNIFLARVAMPRMHIYSKKQQEKLGLLTNKITEAFVNVHVIQSNNAANSFSHSISEVNDDVYKTNVQLASFRTLVFPLVSLMTSLSYLVVLFYGGKLAIQKIITIGDLMAFNAYLALLGFPLMAIGILLAVLQRARTAADRFAEIDRADLESPANTSENYKLSSPLTLEVRNLSYSFVDKEGNKAQVLKNISFTLKPGEHIGIVGPVGSGKSVLFNLITRIYDPPRGTIFFNGIDALDLAPKDIREYIGFATQTVHLFSETIENNLKFGIESASRDDLIKAAKDSEVLDDILSFDKQWDSEVGEKGLRLSGGQKQRLALARTLLRKPPVYLLDDVLSAVDHSTEKNIIQSFKDQEASMLIASHRSSAVKHCNKVIALEDGILVDIGSFEDISKKHPNYFEHKH